jgi:hypothetical protein
MHLFLMINFVGIEPPKATKLRVETRPKSLKQFVSSGTPETLLQNASIATGWSDFSHM